MVFRFKELIKVFQVADAAIQRLLIIEERVGFRATKEFRCSCESSCTFNPPGVRDVRSESFSPSPKLCDFGTSTFHSFPVLTMVFSLIPCQKHSPVAYCKEPRSLAGNGRANRRGGLHHPDR